VKIDKESRHITLAYFEQKSTIDYIGVIQGIPICFDAKECATNTFTLNNIHDHQIEFMEEFEKQKGVAFLIISFTNIDTFYYLPFRNLLEYVKRFENGGKKSFRFDELDPKYILRSKPGILIPYLDALQIDLDERNF
jgi:recombination protein U